MYIEELYPFFKKLYLPTRKKTLKGLMDQMGIGTMAGKLKIVSDPLILDQVDTSKLKPNGIATAPDFMWDETMFQKLDLHSITNTVLFSLQVNPGDDYVIIPIQIYNDILFKFRTGFGDPTLGPSLEYMYEDVDMNAKVFPCQFVRNPYAPERERSDSDSEDEEEVNPLKKLTISPLAVGFCTMQPEFNDMVERLRAYLIE